MGKAELAVPFHSLLPRQSPAIHVHHPQRQQQWRTVHAPAVVPDSPHEAGQRSESPNSRFVPSTRRSGGLQVAAAAYPICGRVLKTSSRTKTQGCSSRFQQRKPCEVLTNSLNRDDRSRYGEARQI